jgi:UDP-glucose 4-epimerase
VVLVRGARPRIALTGVSTRLGRVFARALHRDADLIGIDPRGARNMPKDVTVFEVDPRRRQVDELFKRERVDALVHLIPEPQWARRDNGQRDAIVVGTHRLLDAARKHGVTKAVVISTAAVYGAFADNDQFLTEEAPLLAGQSFGGLRNMVEADMSAGAFLWRHPEVDTVILRPSHVVGHLGNAASRYLAMPTVPTLAGFDPMIQVISPDDLLSAVRLALRPGVRGIFNIAGPSPAPLSHVIRALGRRRLPLAEPLARAMLGLLWGLGASGVPSGSLDYLKYVCMVSGDSARLGLGYEPKLTLDETLAPIRTQRRDPGDP